MDEHERPDERASDPFEVGSVGEEAAKLFGAFADLARGQGSEAASALGAMAGRASAFAHDVDEHLATGSAECRYCPVCRVVHVVRESSPEVRNHLMSAATSLLQAAAGFLETLPPAPGADAAKGDGASPSPRGPSVEKIDLDTDDDDGPERPESPR